MTQQNKGVVSKIFYNIRKNRVAYLEIKWKRQKDLQFGRLVVVVVVGVLLVVVVHLVVVAKRPKCKIFLALSLYKVSKSVFSYVVKNFWYDPLICAASYMN